MPMSRLALLLAAALLPAGAAAQVRMTRVMKIRPIGGHEWEPSTSFKFRGSGWCENGSFIDAAVLPARREIRLVCSDYDDSGRKTFSAQALDADAKLLGTTPLTSTGALDAVYQRVAWLDRGRSAPLAVTWDYSRLRIFNEKGAGSDVPVKDGVAAVAVLGADQGGPLIAVAHSYGESGVEAFRPDGKRLWRTADPVDVRGLSAARLDGRPVLAVWHSTSRLALLGPDGKVRERLLLGGNSDRMAIDDGKEPRLYVLDSKAGSTHEKLTLHLRSKGKEPRWEPAASANLGPITITAQALGRFVPGESRRLVIGTSNGWVFLLDSAGRAAAERKFLSPVRSLTAADLDRDGRDELVVILDGASENVLIFSPQTTP